MDIDDLQYFCDLAETKSLKQTARRNQVTAEHVGHRIRHLEHSLQTNLIGHCRQQWPLTSAGKILYQHSQRILQGYEKLRKAMAATRQVFGRIRVTTTPTMALLDLPPRLTEYAKRFPLTRVRVQCQHPARIGEDVLDYAADVGLVDYPQPDPRLDIVPLYEAPLVVVCHPQHYLAGRSNLQPANLVNRPLIGLGVEGSARQAIDAALRHHALESQAVVEYDNVRMIKRAVRANSGIAVVPKECLARELASGCFVALDLKSERLWRPVTAILKKGKPLSSAMEAFLRLLNQEGKRH